MTLHRQKLVESTDVICVMGVIFATRVDRGGHLHQKGLIFLKKGVGGKSHTPNSIWTVFEFYFHKTNSCAWVITGTAGNIWYGLHASTVVHSRCDDVLSRREGPRYVSLLLCFLCDTCTLKLVMYAGFVKSISSSWKTLYAGFSFSPCFCAIWSTLTQSSSMEPLSSSTLESTLDFHPTNSFIASCSHPAIT